MDGVSPPVPSEQHIPLTAVCLPSPQVHWVLCVQENVLDSVVARLRLRVMGMKCVALRSGEDRSLVEAAVQVAQQQGATVSQTFRM